MFHRRGADSDSAGLTSDCESDIDSKKLVLVSRVAGNISDPRIDRLRRATAKTKTNDDGFIDDLSRTMWVTRGTKRKLKNILSPGVESTSHHSLFDPDETILSVTGNRSSKRGRGRGRGRGGGTRGGRGKGCGAKRSLEATSIMSPLKPPKGRRHGGRSKSFNDLDAKDFDLNESIDDEPSSSTFDSGLQLQVKAEMKDAEDYIKNPSSGVLGAGKGDEKSLPSYEFKSLYQYQIPSVDAEPANPWASDPAELPDDVALIIQSVVGLASLGCELDLVTISEKGQNLSYDPSTFAPLVMRLKQPVSSAMIFRSGRIVISGTKSEKDCKIAAEKYTDIVRQLGFPTKLLGYRVVNISATCNLQFRVRVHLLGKDVLFKNFVSFHPELFTGVSVRLACPRCTIMIFCTGSVLITGVRSEEEAHRALKKIYSLAKIYAN